MYSLLNRSAVAGLIAITMATATPTPAQAQSPSLEDLRAQIIQLIAALNANQLGNTSGAGTVSFGPYTWTRSLTIGSTGDDVRQLQRFLNTNPATRVAVAGAGSPGQETTYFGPATAAAVTKFQELHRTTVLTPSGLVRGTGYFGPATIRQANQLANTQVVTPPTSQPPTSGGNDDEPEDTLRGEGTLDTVEFDLEESRVQEAAADEVVATLTLEPRFGDIEVNRIDLRLVADPGNDERDPWDTFERMSLWVDGEQLASQSLDDRRDYLNRTMGTVRFSGLDLVIPEDESVTIEVALSLPNNVDGAGTNARWTLSTERVRYFDADRVATDDGATDDLGTGVTFDIDERGAGEELKFSLSDNNPRTSNIIVDEDRRTNGVTILEYQLTALDADIELDRLFVNIETGTADVADVVQDVQLQIGSRTFRDTASLATGTYSGTSTRVEFDIDGDVTIDEDDWERVRVIVDLQPQQGNYQNGETILARVTSAERDATEAEGSDDITDFSGSAIGDRHTLVAEGLIVNQSSFRATTDTQGINDTTGVFTLSFEVTAVEGDFYLTDVASTSVGTTTGGVGFTVDSPTGTTTSIAASLSATAREQTPGVFTIREGESEEFTLTVVIDAATAGSHRVTLTDLYYAPQTDGTTDATQYRFLPSQDYRSNFRFINE